MDVSFGNMGNAKAVLLGNVKVGINIAFGVDHDGFAGALTTDKVTGLRQTRIENVLEKHNNVLFLMLILLVILYKYLVANDIHAHDEYKPAECSFEFFARNKPGDVGAEENTENRQSCKRK